MIITNYLIMASFKMDIPHQLSQAEALLRIKQLLGKVQEEQKGNISNVQERWDKEKGQFKFNAKGYELKGLITVNNGNIHIDAEVPFAVTLFKGKIKQLIDQQAKLLLA